jgi:hypothetical protein
MAKTLLQWYRHYRVHGSGIVGESAKGAMRAARIRMRFDALESDDLVRLHLEPECDMYDDSYIDTWGFSEEKVKREKAKIWRRIEREGCWILVGQFRASDEDAWESADSIGGFIGDDWQDSGYDIDIMHATLDAFDALYAALPVPSIADAPCFVGIGS